MLIIPTPNNVIQINLNLMKIPALNIQEHLHKVPFPALKRIPFQTTDLQQTKDVVMVFGGLVVGFLQLFLLVYFFHVTDRCHGVGVGVG